ncbi:hypothetical protein G7047_21680 [Diaphorobacter sp. HDW4A]|uniref:hypothetical protein n=1 Tax=Diaphorobacter sp. HDW4A TaxID=2714924 RepID=UPI00140BEB15|nr:hypothetical protein [Diaphorobacter sp. HDW4A]QIL82252.1 hypothetical protein G7047_21680 [Diaphorobacter sp. HDW4A]
MPEADLVAIAAHLHVLLRRNAGRVTDTEWMAVNVEYAQAIIAFARQHAERNPAADLLEWAGKLEQAWLDHLNREQRVPLVQRASDMLRQRVEAKKYIGSLR